MIYNCGNRLVWEGPMGGFLIDAKHMSGEEAEKHRQEHFPHCTAVNQPWHSYGPVFVVSGTAYFHGNPNDPNDMCGREPLSMNMRSMSPSGVCPVDGTTSYILIPND
jgi:hypothetical protein